ncbi:MAG: hypothetical protein KJ754_16825, partial [Bacteroidetes bacterium]|nr:hypothetical protein [Bacteroidota bacterium]
INDIQIDAVVHHGLGSCVETIYFNPEIYIGSYLGILGKRDFSGEKIRVPRSHKEKKQTA